MTSRRQRIFSCPGCSLRLTGLESECPKCKRRFGEDSELECPFCGTLVSPRLDHCPSCGIDYSEFADHAEEQLWQKALDKIVEEIEELRTEDRAGSEGPGDALEPPAPHETPRGPETDEEALCPVCQRVVSSSDSVCPGCGAEFEDGEDAYDDSTAVCPVCGETVSYEAPACPCCGAEFEDEGETEEPEEAAKVLQRPPLRAPGTPAVADERGGLIAKTPAVKAHAGSGLSNGFSVTNGSGIINGKGQTNGIQFVNGLGAVNGKDLINGSGTYNGTGSGRLQGRRRRQQLPIYMRWQIIAVLVAVAIIVPSYLQFSKSGDDGPYSIDGDFGDWEEAVMFTVTSVSPDVDPDVVEWAAARHTDNVYLYVRMSQEAMTGLAAQRLVLFIDSDDSPGSGYSVGGVGADYMIELFGWNSSIATSAISRYHLTEDQADWNGWAVSGPVECLLAGDRLEAKARLVGGLDESAKFILTAQDEYCVNCISYPVVLSGGVLIIEQSPTPEVKDSEVVPIGPSTGILRLRFTCQGAGGTVEGVVPVLSGVTSSEQVQPFSIEVGQERLIDLMVDSSGLTSGQFVSAAIAGDGVSSSFAHVEIVGDGTRAYANCPPSGISIDGAFADWENLTVKDVDSIPLENRNIDIDSVGANTTDQDAFFYVSVYGEICAGTYIPQGCAIPSGQGGGAVVTARKTAEDFIRVYIDSDRTRSTGRYVSIGSLVIGADYMIEVKGLCREIVSVTVNRYDGTGWVATTAQADAAKDTSRMEIGVESSAIGENPDIDFIIETTDWSGTKDQATDSAYGLGMRTWAIDSSATSSLATESSNQRKIFYDGSNFWSIYFDGSSTVYGYSTDGGETWTTVGDVFSTSGVRRASLWYDSSEQLVYAIGDTSSSSVAVRLQRGVVDPVTQEIEWQATDSQQAVTTYSLASKNSFICKDLNGYLWIIGTDMTQTGPSRYNMGVYKSTSVDDITSWTLSGSILDSGSLSVDIKGTILPAGSGSDVWAVYNYDTTVAARKCTGGSWGSEEEIYSASGTLDFINTAPASSLVDDDGVLHVVYGDGTKSGSDQRPHIMYSYRDSVGWESSERLDESGDTVGQKHPSIALDNSTGDIYAIWIRMDNNNVVCKVNVSGSWSFVTIGEQTSHTKQHLSAIYSVSGEGNICWQWTQNTTGTIEVMFDKIPEFEDLALPVLTIIVVFALISRRRRGGAKDERQDETRA